MKLLFVIIFCALLFGCHNPVSLNSDVKQVSAEPVNLPISLFSPYIRLAVLDSFLVIQEKDAEKNTLAILYDMRNNTPYYFAKGGEGPGELLIVFELTTNTINRTIEINDPVKREYNIFSVDSILNNCNYKPRQISFKSLPELTYVRLSCISQDKFISTGTFTSGIIGIVNTSTNNISYIKDKPQGLDNEDFYTIGRSNDYIPVYSHYHKRTALFSRNSDCVTIYDSVFNKISEVRSDGVFDPLFTKEIKNGHQYIFLTKKSVNAYRSVVATTKYIYGLYSGLNEIDQEKSGHGRSLHKIHRFDWQGKLDKTIILDSPVMSFTVDNDDKYLYGITLKNDESKVVKFAL